MVLRDRVLIRWRKYLIEQRDKHGVLAPSTASHRMAAVILFYRYARANGLIGHDAPMWHERSVCRKYIDTKGFERTMVLPSTDLSIPNRARHGAKLESGLQPLTKEQMHHLLNFASKNGGASRELTLMLKLGFFTGARIETIADLKRGTLEKAVPDQRVPGFILLAVGPGHLPLVATKHGVQGRILVPRWLHEELINYVGDVARLRREAHARPEDKDLLFLTRFGRSYVDRTNGCGSAAGRAVLELRRKATAAGLSFASRFHFHMTRATYGTWLAEMLLSIEGINEKAVIDFIRDAMLHKDIETTLGYIKFVKSGKIKSKVANEFTQAFLGLRAI